MNVITHNNRDTQLVSTIERIIIIYFWATALGLMALVEMPMTCPAVPM